MNEMTDKRQKVLKTTLDMILENGIQSASMGKISKASGVAVGTIYHYFSSKEELITELYKTIKLKILETFKVLQYQSDAKETFKLIMKTYINYAIQYPKEFEFVERYCRSPIIDFKVKEDIKSKFYSENVIVIQLLSEKNQLKDMSPELILLYVENAITSALRSHISGEVNLSDKDFGEYVEMIWDGIKK